MLSDNDTLAQENEMYHYIVIYPQIQTPSGYRQIGLLENMFNNTLHPKIPYHSAPF